MPKPTPLPTPTLMPTPTKTQRPSTPPLDDATDVFHTEMIRLCMERVMETRARLLADVRRLRFAGVDAGCAQAVALAELLSGDMTADLSGFDGKGFVVGGDVDSDV